MENQVKTNKNVKSEEKKEIKFIKRSEMTKEDILALEKYNVIFQQGKTNNGASFFIEVATGDHSYTLNAPGTKDRVYINSNDWSFIKLLHHKTGSCAMELPVRFIEGKGKTGRVYHRWEFFSSIIQSNR